MKLKRLQIDGYKNLRSCDIEFTQSPLINAVIGSNGSGKSNLIEAIIQILIGCYFEKAPQFQFRLEFEAQNRLVVLQREGRRASVMVDGERMHLGHFAKRLRDGPAQVFYPELTLIYYSGECQRVQQLVARYRRHFQKLTRNPETDRFRPLFVQSSNEQSQVILLALFAHNHRELLDRLQLEGIVEVTVVLRSPDGFDPEEHEPKLWNTVGAIRRIVASLDATSTTHDAFGVLEISREMSMDGGPGRRRLPIPMERSYHFKDGPGGGIDTLAQRLQAAGDNVYLALESLRARGLLRSVSFKIKRRKAPDLFSFDALSEGEKQLLAVVGAVRLTNQKDNLVLLDEPDTHLNPHWSWDYPGMLAEAFKPEQQPRSTVLMATHDPVMISGMVRDQVLLAKAAPDQPLFSRPHRNPRGQGVANLLCSSEFFGLPSSLDKETQKLLDERLAICIKERLTEHDTARLKALNAQLEIMPGVSERDPDYVAFLRQRHAESKTAL